MRIKRSWLLSVSGLVWIMGCVKARWFADRTHKATKGLPVFYVQELAFRDLWSKQSVNIFSLGPTAFFSAEGLESIILRKILSELHVHPLKKIWNEELTATNDVFLHIIWCSKLLISGLFMI